MNLLIQMLCLRNVDKIIMLACGFGSKKKAIS